jgi:hypothetical protein
MKEAIPGHIHPPVVHRVRGDDVRERVVPLRNLVQHDAVHEPADADENAATVARWLGRSSLIPDPFWDKDAVTRFPSRTDFVKPRAYRSDMPETIVTLTNA